jgi:hypothetical protein
METILSQFELPKDTQGNFKAKYRHCPAFISGSLKITTNFNTHIKVSKNMLKECFLFFFNFFHQDQSVLRRGHGIYKQMYHKIQVKFI